MNTATSVGGILRDFTALLTVRWEHEATHDGYRSATSLYEADREGFPVMGGEQQHVESRIDGRLLASLRFNGAGPLVNIIQRDARTAVSAVLEEHALRRLVRRIDMALFALDHDGGHGPDATAAGIRELWAASGADTWAAYAAKREVVLRWLEEFREVPR